MSLAGASTLSMALARPFESRLALGLFLWMLAAPSFGFSILTIEAQRESETRLMVAVESEIELTADVIEALESSIPITIQTTIKLYRVRNNLWDKLIHESEFQVEIAYQSLYRTYRLKSTDPNFVDDYPTLDRVLESLGERRTYRVDLEDDRFHPDQNYVGKIKISLDRSALPSVMRLPVFFKNSWHLQSSQIKFDIQ